MNEIHPLKGMDVDRYVLVVEYHVRVQTFVIQEITKKYFKLKKNLKKTYNTTF